MKNLKTLFQSLRKLALFAVLACSVAVSCTTMQEYDDSEIKEQIEIIINKIYELEQKMNSEIQALKDMLAGKLLITSVKTDSQTGITTVNLSNGTSFELLPEKDLKSFVTYITLSDGIDYWAYIDENGKKQLFLDENGEAVPVLAEIPEVVVKDGETWIVVGGVEYPLAGNSVFSDYELIKDELTGEIYAVTFTFGEEMSFTVTVDGAAGFFFVKPSGWSTVAISDYFVPLGMTERVQVDARGVVDYVLQIPDGWRVKEYKDVFMGALYFDITAPSQELVESGMAASEGYLKVVAVLEGGKATIAKLYLSSDPFKEFSVSLGKATVKMYNGLQKFVYGVCTASSYNEDTIFKTAESLLDAYEYPAGYGVSDFDLDGMSLSEIAGRTLTAGNQYVFWAIPALYYSTDEESGYYLKEGTFTYQTATYSSVKFEVGNASTRDAQLDMELKGVGSYYTELLPKAEFMIEDVVYNLNNSGYYTARTTPKTFSGSVFEFAGVKAEQATEYVAWLAVAEDGKTYTAADVVVCEFSTLNLVAGSSVKVEASAAEETVSDVSISLTAAGAEKIYYSYVTTAVAKTLATDDDKADYLFVNGVAVEGETVEAKATDVIEVKPATSYVFLAVATDASGKYSEVVTVECKTKAIEFNDLKVVLSLEKNDPGNVVVSISAEGAVDYLYWIGRTADNIWKSANYLGGSAAKAQNYMYANAGHERFTSVMEAYPVVDGTITMTDLVANVGYVIVAMAKDKDGLYSKATDLRFTPRDVAIGEVVLSSDPKWEAARPTIEWIPSKFEPATGMMSGRYGYYVTIPSGFTGYVLAGTDDYLTEGNPQLKLSVEDKILKIIEYTDKHKDSDYVVDYDLWGEKGWPYGSEFYSFEHGDPLFGNVVIWASKEFHDSVCDCGHPYVGTGVYNNVEVEVKHVLHVNDGTPIEMRQPYAVGSKTKVVDKVFVVCQDLDGNCYEPFVIGVPVEYFKNATAN